MQLKRIDPNALIYHYFERSISEYALFDDDLDMPVSWGSRNLVDGTVRKLPASVTVVYYRRDFTDRISYKKRLIYDGKKEVTKSRMGLNSR